jgi:hypothetical protein
MSLRVHLFPQPHHPFHSSGGKALKFQNQWPRAPRRPTPAVAVLPQEGPNRAAPRRRRQPPPPLLTSKTWLPQCLGPQPQAPPLPRRCARSCSGGMTRTVGTFHGDAQAAARKRGRTRCGCRRWCCSRRGCPWSSATTSGGWRGGPPCEASPPLRRRWAILDKLGKEKQKRFFVWGRFDLWPRNFVGLN